MILNDIREIAGAAATPSLGVYTEVLEIDLNDFASTHSDHLSEKLEALIVAELRPLYVSTEDFEWAGVPFMLIRPKNGDAQWSRPDGVMAGVAFTSNDALRSAIAQFVAEQMSVHKIGTSGAVLDVRAVAERLNVEWMLLDRGERLTIAANVGLSEDDVTSQVEDSIALGTASFVTGLSLVKHLAPDFVLASSGYLPELDDREKAALAAAAEEYDWTTWTVFNLTDAARLQMMSGGKKRQRFTTIGAWKDLHDSILRGE
jgi:hypothetical protein